MDMTGINRLKNLSDHTVLLSSFLNITVLILLTAPACVIA